MIHLTSSPTRQVAKRSIVGSGDSISQHLIHLTFNFLLLEIKVVVGTHIHRCGVSKKVDGMIGGMWWR